MEINVKELIAAAEAISKNKGIKDEDVIYALSEAIKAAYIRNLGGGTKDMPDPVVTCDIDLSGDKGTVKLAQIKTVRDEVEDDMLEIETEEANEGLKEPKYKDGDEYIIPATMDEASKAFAMGVKSSFRQKLGEAERSALYEIYKDHIGEMMNGTVERADDRGVSVNIGRTSVELSRHELIGDEFFHIGDPIKVYIQKVESALPSEPGKRSRGPQIQATRSSEGFLKRLFEEEIHEIYDGTVVIKAIARKAGVRSKVAVATNNDDVDPTGACIGQGGSRIQRIVAQLGNGKSKEKIDVIPYSDDLALFVAEASRPASVIGVNLSEPDELGKREAYAIIHDGESALAMGKFKSNIDLARKLTGVHIDFVEESIASEKGIAYIPVDELRERAEILRKEKAKEEYLKKTREEAARRQAEEEAARKRMEEEAAARIKEEEAKREAAKEEAKKALVTPIVPREAPKTGARPEQFPAEAANPAAAALAELLSQSKAKESVETEQTSEAPSFVAPVEDPDAKKEVKTTTTLSDLEAQLEASKEKKTRPAKKGKPRKIEEPEAPKSEPVKPASQDNAMPVYTEEELARIEEEETSLYDGDLESDEDIDQDYADYDQYYDDEK